MTIKNARFLIAFLILASCDYEEVEVTRDYNPRPNVNVQVKTKTIEEWEDENIVVLVFNMTVNVKYGESIIKIGNIKTRLNGAESIETRFDTIADYEGNYVPKTIRQGEHIYELISAFPPDVWQGEVHDFEMIEFGVSEGSDPVKQE